MIGQGDLVYEVMAPSESVEIHLLLSRNGPMLKKNKKGCLKKGKRGYYFKKINK